MLIDWIFSGKLVYFAASESFSDTFCFGQFDSDVGDLFHLFPIFHLISFIIEIISSLTKFGVLFSFGLKVP